MAFDNVRRIRPSQEPVFADEFSMSDNFQSNRSWAATARPRYARHRRRNLLVPMAMETPPAPSHISNPDATEPNTDNGYTVDLLFDALYRVLRPIAARHILQSAITLHLSLQTRSQVQTGRSLHDQQ